MTKQLPTPTDEDIEYLAGQLERMAAEVRHRRPIAFRLDTRNHVIDVPDEVQVHRVDGGLGMFEVAVEWAPVADLPTRVDAGRGDAQAAGPAVR